jgi:hypothetical protein
VGPTQDSPDFTPALQQAAALLAIDTVLADAAYDAEHNHQLCRDTLGIRQSIVPLNPRNTGRRWPRTPYRRALRQHFPHATYQQRWHAESGFSRHKRRLGSALTTRTTPRIGGNSCCACSRTTSCSWRDAPGSFQQSKWLRQPRRLVERQERTPEGEERLMDVDKALVADHEPPLRVQVRERAHHDEGVSPQTCAQVHAAAGDPHQDAARAQRAPGLWEVVRLARVAWSLAGRRWSWPTRTRTGRRHRSAA